jgi:hypothetical protein
MEFGYLIGSIPVFPAIGESPNGRQEGSRLIPNPIHAWMHKFKSEPDMIPYLNYHLNQNGS